MKQIILKNGLLSGLLVSTFMVCSMAYLYRSEGSEGSMLLGYASMLAAFTFIFIGIKNHRDKNLDGKISFLKAFLIGIGISAIASIMYVAAWGIEYHFFMPDFLEKYSSASIEKLQKSNLSTADLESKIKEIIQTSPELNIFYQGWLSGEEKSDYFLKSDCLVLPSYYEGFPNVVLEAMNNDLPVICSDTTSLPEILDNGNCGLLYSAGNQNEFIQCILKVQNSPIETYQRTQNAKERMKNKFDINKSRQQLHDLLISLNPQSQP